MYLALGFDSRTKGEGETNLLKQTPRSLKVSERCWPTALIEDAESQRSGGPAQPEVYSKLTVKSSPGWP